MRCRRARGRPTVGGWATRTPCVGCGRAHDRPGHVEPIFERHHFVLERLVSFSASPYEVRYRRSAPGPSTARQEGRRVPDRTCRTTDRPHAEGSPTDGSCAEKTAAVAPISRCRQGHGRRRLGHPGDCRGLRLQRPLRRDRRHLGARIDAAQEELKSSCSPRQPRPRRRASPRPACLRRSSGQPRPPHLRPRHRRPPWRHRPRVARR